MSATKYQWTPLTRNYETERKNRTKAQETTAHPLVPSATPSTPSSALSSSSSAIPSSPSPAATSSIVNNASARGSVQMKVTAVDPLSSDPLSAGNSNDPLRTMSISDTSDAQRKAPGSPGKVVEEEEIKLPDNFVPWSAMKPGILSTYTTNESLAITVNFMKDTAGVQKVKVPVDKVKDRLEQLDQMEEEGISKETMQVTQKDYIAHIESLHTELSAAWEAEERVKALKLAIQCAKLLSDTTVIKFYPSKFVLITEILDTFGKLVYERLRRRSSDGKPAKTEQFQISDQAKETCRNWFYKIASIRELLPRIYVEMAIIKCYDFLKGDTHTEMSEVIGRLSSTIRGVGNPLVAMYTRTYLARKAFEVAPKIRAHLQTGFDDFLETQKQNESERVKTLLAEQRVSTTDYLGLFSPALEWLLQCIASGAPRSFLEHILNRYAQFKNAVVLNHIISSFPPEFIASNALTFTKLIREADPSYPKHQLYRSLGVNLAIGKPQREEVFPILNDVWKVVTKIEDINEYLSVAEVWVEYPLKNCGPKEVNILLRDIFNHVSKDKIYENPTVQQHLQSITQKVLLNLTDFSTIISMDKFLPIFDLFSGDTLVQVSKGMLENFAKSKEISSDPVIISTMFSVGKAVHDSVNSLSFADEIRQIGQLLVSFISKVDFGRDLERHLQFFTDCRQAFSNLDSVKSRLVMGVLQLAMKTLGIVHGKHSKKTAAFVRTCFAYCYSTIPAMDDVFGRLYLYLLAGNSALMNNSLPQADAFFKAAITLVQEVPAVMEVDGQVKSSEEQLVAFFQNFLSALVVVPGHPEHGPFYLIKGLLKVVKDYPWEKGSLGKARVLVGLLPLYSAYYQSTLPYHIDRVESNDELYGGDTDYLEEILTNIDKTVEEVIEDVGKLKDDVDAQAQRKASRVALDLFNTSVANAELNAKTATMLYNVFLIAQKGLAGTPEQSYLKSSLSALSNHPAKLAPELLKKLQAAQ